MVLDIIIIAIILISGFIGIKKGFVSIIVKLVGFILSLVLAYTFYGKLADYLYANYDFGNKINNSIKEAIESSTNEEDTEKQSIDELIAKFGLEEKINIQEEEENLEAETTLSVVIAEKITGYVMNILAFLIIFVVIVVIAGVAGLILSAIFSIPGLKELNKTGGFVLEIVLSILKLWVVLQIISILSPLGFMSWINTQIDNTIFVKFLYNNNLLGFLISNIKI